MNAEPATLTVRFDRPLTSVRVDGVTARRQPAAAPPAPDSRKETPAPSVDAQAIRNLFSQVHDRIASLEESRRASSRLIHQIAVELAITVTGKILFQAFEENAFPIDAMVSELMKNVDKDERITIHVNPTDWELLQETGSTEKWFTDDSLIDWRSAPDLGRGAVRMETGRFALLSDSVLQLQEIRQVLMEVLGDAEIERRKTDFGGKSLRRFPDRRTSG